MGALTFFYTETSGLNFDEFVILLMGQHKYDVTSSNHCRALTFFFSSTWMRFSWRVVASSSTSL